VNKRLETWGPLVFALIYWLAMYPGLFGEDSLITLEQARHGPIDAWFTAWWIYLIKIVTLNTTVIPALTLAGVLLFTWSVRVWATTVFPAGPSRMWAILLISASPLVGAFGIQVRHDAWMTSGLLLIMAAMARLRPGCGEAGASRGTLEAGDYGLLLIAAPLIATRHNGVPTVIVAAIAWRLWRGREHSRLSLALIGVAAIAVVITWGATHAAGLSRSTDPAQVVEWVMADTSCLLSKDGVVPTEADWSALETIADRRDWPQPVACAFVNPLFIAPSFHQDRVAPNIGRLVSAWLSLARQHPVKMLGAHVTRLSFFLPPFLVRDPARTPFIHSTILPNTLGLAWAFPQVAEAVRLPIRGWNALRVVLANLPLWLAVLWLTVRRRHDLSAALRPALLIGVIMELSLLVTAPIAEGRYGLPILVTGQLTMVYLLLERRGS